MNAIKKCIEDANKTYFYYGIAFRIKNWYQTFKVYFHTSTNHAIIKNNCSYEASKNKKISHDIINSINFELFKF